MQFTKLNEAVTFLESFIKPTVFERIKENSHLEDPLDRMRVLLHELGDPQHDFRSIQVSGTSGKGSTSYLTALLLQNAGYKTGLATSPHLQTIHERMQVNLQKIDDQQLLKLINLVVPTIMKMRTMAVGEPSYFELVTALSFMYFADKKVDIAVIEVGLEGKYDATNVLDPSAVILTNISLDHTELLGATEQEIAEEAMSIVRKNAQGKSPLVVTGIEQPEIRQMLSLKAQSAVCHLKVLGQDFSYVIQSQSSNGTTFDFHMGNQLLEELELRLRGEYQVKNASLALATVLSLENSGFQVEKSTIYHSFLTAFFPGRFEVIKSDDKTIILDGAHNKAKMDAFLNSLERYYPNTDKVFIVGFKKGKDIQTMIKQLFSQSRAAFIFTTFHNNGGYTGSNSTDLLSLQSQIEEIDSAKEARYTSTVPQAFTAALKYPAKIVVVTGSLYLVGELREYLFPTFVEESKLLD